MLSRKVDVHSHLCGHFHLSSGCSDHACSLPPVYDAALRKAGLLKPEGMPGIPTWSLETHLKLKDDLNISKSYVRPCAPLLRALNNGQISVSAPGTHLVPGQDKEARELTRECNDYGAKLKRDYPDRFGLFASLPLPDVEGALAEIDYAIDVCQADGFILMASSDSALLGR
jgi:hypothetical protein